MFAPHPHEAATLRLRVEVLEAELQRAREIISAKCDHEARLVNRIAELIAEVHRLGGGSW